MRLIHDRYVIDGEDRCCDLATGETMSRAEADASVAAEGGLAASPELAPLMEVLEQGQDGGPRWVISIARGSAHADSVIRCAAAGGRARGFIPIAVPLYRRFRQALGDDLKERALLLLGGFASPPAQSSEALVEAASRSPRPHVLVTFRPPAGGRGSQHVREARAAFGTDSAPRRPAPAAVHPEVARHLARAARATEFIRAGRHAAAERLLRDVAGALGRRNAFAATASTLTALGRLLLERGRTVAADEVFGHAIIAAEGGRHEHLVVDGRLWQALARTDAGNLTDAESICRAVLLARPGSPDQHAWASAILARVLLWRGTRPDDVAALALSPESTLDASVRASSEAAAVRVLLAAGETFDAGQRARALLEAPAIAFDPVAGVIAYTAHVRVLVATGDLTLAQQAVSRTLELTTIARTPLRAARVRLIWFEMLRRAGRQREAQREAEYLKAIAPRTPALLQRAIVERLAHDASQAQTFSIGARISPRAGSVVPLLRTVHELERDRDAVTQVIEWLAGELQASRVDLVSADAGPVSAIASVGSGLPTSLGPRVLAAGTAVPAERQRGGLELGVPVRFAGRTLGALVCRWPVDREPSLHAIELADMASAIAGPRVDGLLTHARDKARASIAVPDLVGISAGMTEVRRGIERAAAAPFAVLIEGESGSGKELVARAIHQLSPRRERRFCDVNCAALPDDLLESELFGHARGAFTGAVAERAGLFEEASDGTIFLDELPDLSPRGQAKLLRVLQQQEVRRVGETFSRKIDVRLVTATNRDMHVEVAEGRFRQDLLYRLDVIRIRIPPLRDRPEDVPVLAERFWADASARVGSTARLTHGVLAELSRYHWPGNVRELQNVMAALAVGAPSRGRVHPSLLPAAITGTATVTARRLDEARTQFERRCVEVALARAGGNRTRAAAELGLSRQGLLKTMARVGIA